MLLLLCTSVSLSVKQRWQPSLLHRDTARLNSLMFAKLLRNPLMGVAAQHEHIVVLVCVFYLFVYLFFKNTEEMSKWRVTNIIHCLFRNSWWNPSQQGKRVCKGDEKKADAKWESSGTRRAKASIFSHTCLVTKKKIKKKKKENEGEGGKREKKGGREGAVIPMRLE